MHLLRLSFLLGLAAAVYKLWIQQVLVLLGYGRTIESLGNTDCVAIPALAACEKIVLHQPTGLLFLACSTVESRAHWIPAVDQLNTSGPANVDYFATYNHDSGDIVRLEAPLPVETHGMDVVPSAADPSQLYIYAINHRKVHSALTVGADSTIEVFVHNLGAAELKHLHTVRDPTIIAPNDVVGHSNGREFFWTNDHASKTGHMRHLSVLGLETGSVGYCNLDSGCKMAIRHLRGANGIARQPDNGTVFVGNCIFGGVHVLETQPDNTLVKKSSIPIDRPIDNLSIDKDGVLWAAGMPYPLSLLKHLANPSLLSPTSAHAAHADPNSSSQFRVVKMFEDDGNIARATTTVVHDAERRRLFLHGNAAPHLTVCNL
ncbi:hypothetical protein FB45DRAFT_893403 [Roridomyces roridus]|uniref:SMP-30/Gluconolactonase/LRE-like region domain-containing protein n=1 Tax=Roridomyces roridus TaxID=1738132 RepID=A0AAD7CFE8_9AGAR|nr:hypothetical protein FB45DRAFT_893403 [Roridomyces roridus]